MIKRIWKVIVLFGSMLLICGCGKEKLSEEDFLVKIYSGGVYGDGLDWGVCGLRVFLCVDMRFI